MSFIIKKSDNLRINGVGIKNSQKMYKNIGLNSRVKEISIKLKQKNRLSYLAGVVSYSETLKLKVQRAIDFYIRIRSYKGVRHLNKRPVRGQRTRTNAKTRKRVKKIILNLKPIKKSSTIKSIKN
jgi:small subunit ribosomal protein S13